eukprot:Pgem_evm1s18047
MLHVNVLNNMYFNHHHHHNNNNNNNKSNTTTNKNTILSLQQAKMNFNTYRHPTRLFEKSSIYLLQQQQRKEKLEHDFQLLKLHEQQKLQRKEEENCSIITNRKSIRNLRQYNTKQLSKINKQCFNELAWLKSSDCSIYIKF